ncbi:MAG: DNA-directed RNA polymerase subunit omega [Candidatus Omnitrophica bacterium]|nr:DNA-directed RNA polymerase subunit omega [Candidatus Omnitrophota bacterium]
MVNASVYFPIEPLLERIPSIYKLVIVAARRALELNDGAPRLAETDPKFKPATVALYEIAAGKVGLKPKPEKRKREEI